LMQVGFGPFAALSEGCPPCLLPESYALHAYRTVFGVFESTSQEETIF